MTEEKIESNEFDDLDMEEDVPTSELSEVPGDQSDMISSGTSGTTYDWNSAPEGVKAPPREDLDGQTVVLKKADIVLPPMSRPWSKTRAGDKEFKYCSFTLLYDVNGQQEFYSGVRVFNKDGKYSHPTLTRDRKNQASKLLGIYADYKKKDINEVSLKEFMAFLNSKPKVVIKGESTENPETGDFIKKNMVGNFVAD